MTLLSSLGSVDSADASFALWDLSRLVRNDPSLTAAFDAGVHEVLSRIESPEFLGAWASFLEEFGSRGPDEWDIASPSWETHPELALAALDRVRLQSDEQSPRLRNQRGVDARDASTAAARIRLAGNAEMLGLLDAGLTAGQMMATRSPVSAVRPASPGVWRGWCSTLATRATSSPATYSSLRTPIRAGRRCSCRHRPSWWTSAARSATPS